MTSPLVSRATNTLHPKRAFGTLLTVFGILSLLGAIFLKFALIDSEKSTFYAEGTVADTTITTSIEIKVMDNDATEKMREIERLKIPALLVHDPMVEEDVAKRVLASYDMSKGIFLAGLKNRWTKPLGEAELKSVAFTEFIAVMRAQLKPFPLSTHIAATWAEDSPDELRTKTVLQLREVQRYYILAEPLTKAQKGSSESAWILPASQLVNSSQLDLIQQSAHPLPIRSIKDIESARAVLADKLIGQGAGWTAYLLEFIAPNLRFSEEATGIARRAASDHLERFKTFTEGAPIAREGEIITSTEAAAQRLMAKTNQTSKSANQIATVVLMGFGFVTLGAGLVIRVQACSRIRALSRAPTRESQTSGDDQTASPPNLHDRIANYEERIAKLQKEFEQSNEGEREILRTKISLARKELEIEKAKSDLTWN